MAPDGRPGRVPTDPRVLDVPRADATSIEDPAPAKLRSEPVDWLRVLPLGAPVELDEAHEELRIRNAAHHVLEAGFVEPSAASSHLPPEGVGAIVELDRRKQPLVVGEPLRE